MLFPLVTPEIVMGVSLLLVFTHVFTFIGTGTLAQILGHDVLDLFVVVIVRGRLFSIGRQFEEAAADLGASPTVALTRVLLPLRPPRSSRRPCVRHLRRRLRHQPVASSGGANGHRADQDLQCDAFCAAAFDERDRDDHDGDHVALPRLRLRRLALPHSRGALLDAKSLPGSRSEMARGEIRLVDLTKRFADVTAVDALNLEILEASSSRCSALGLRKDHDARLIAGFERPSEGRILLDETDVAYTPHRRNVNTVFQNYAPSHLNVFDNISFGLRRAKRPKAEIRERVGRAPRAGAADRLRGTKVVAALGRPAARCARQALVLNPAVLLLDEPLGALDAKLRRLFRSS